MKPPFPPGDRGDAMPPDAPARRTPQGKIGRLPYDVREAVNARLLNNEPARKILGWLNATPEQVWVCAEYFDAEPVSAKNLSDWRSGGFRDWLARREKADALKGMSAFAVELAKSSGLALTDAAAAIAGGNILSMMERMEDADAVGLVESLTALRRTDIDREKVRLKSTETDRKERELALAVDSFQWKAAGEVLKWGATAAVQKILAGGEDDSAKMEQLVLTMFGNRPEKEAPDAS